MNYTIVTCLYDLKKRDNTEKRRDINFYLNLTQDFECNIVIYTEPGLKDEILKRKTKGNIKIIEKDFEKLNYHNLFQDDLKYSIKDDKNTDNYFILTWNKFMFMKESIENNYFNTDYFYWLDYGLQHVFNEKGNNPKINTLLENFEKIEKKGIEKTIFMILNDLNPNIINNENFYNKLYQYCAGGIFGGKKDNFIKVIELFDNKLKDLMNKKIVSTEEHIMADVIYNNKDLFELSYGDYYELIDNFYPYEIKENKDYVIRILNLNLSNNEDNFVAMDIIKKMYPNFYETTVVTCLYDLTKYHDKARDINTSIDNIKDLLYIPCNLIIYGDNITLPLIKEIRDKRYLKGLTKYILLPLEEIFTYKYLDKVEENRKLYWPTRDERTCSESHLLVCNKFDFVEKSIKENPFNNNKFCWIDAQIKRICENYSHDKFINLINNVSDKFQVQILNVVDKKYKFKDNIDDELIKKEYYQNYRWLVCGGLFTCSKDKIYILNRLKEIFVKTTKLGFGHGEEMFYLEILDEYYDDIKRSYGDYKQIINNFSEIKLNHHYIYHNIFIKFYDLIYRKECYDCGIKLIESIEKGYVNFSNEIYFDIIFKMYICSYYVKGKEEAKKYVNYIFNNKDLYNKYLINKGFYDTQFSYCK